VYGSYRGYEVGVVAQSTIPEEWLPSIDVAFRIGDGIFTAFFVFDVGLRIALLGRRFFKVCMNYIDLLVTAASVVELVASQMTMNPMLFRLLRIGKLARALRMVTMSSVLSSLQLLIKCLSASADMLVWTFCLLTFIQCVAGMVVSTLCSEFLKDTGQSIELREEVYRYYGTFTRTFLTMFEILFANWSPPCRVLVENVSEWFSVFFLLYRCVVNAVFVQQTMKTASSDEELAFKQKEKDIAANSAFVCQSLRLKVTSSAVEFSKLVTSPKLKFWMSQLELEYHDLLSLFEFLDNGDEQITLQEFIEGASRLRGQAKALDVWRLETKLEVLFEVQNAFKNSLYSHIKSNAKSVLCKLRRLEKFWFQPVTLAENEETENEVYAHFFLEPVQGNLSGRTRPTRPPPLTLTGSSGTEPQI
ncbi:Voltage-dependent T-type calcium channel subunit alpha-1H, partial [Symbiodinium microadriaticum]